MLRSFLLAVLGTLSAALFIANVHAADGSAGSVIYILDCSSNMGDGAEPDSLRKSARSTKPRMDQAKDMLHKLVADAVRNDYKVGVMLYGHRLAWTDDSDTPGIMDNTEYLAHTNTFSVLQSLVPGEDVERVQSLKLLQGNDLVALSARLQTVQPWGESPLYMALVHAAAELGMQSLGSEKSIVVLTSGGNHQRFAHKVKTMADVHAAFEGRRITVNFVGFGNEDQSTAVDELKSVAQATRGQFVAADAGPEEVSFAKLVLDAAQPEEEVAQTEELAPAIASQANPVSAAALPRPREQLLEGQILYYGKPVSKATVRLENSSTSAVETDREGRFKFTQIMPGSYKLSIRAIAKNKIREKTLDLNVGDRAKREAFVTVDVK